MILSWIAFAAIGESFAVLRYGAAPVAREVLGGGSGGRYYADGNDAIHIVPDSRNQPAEFTETRFPLLVEKLALRTDSALNEDDLRKMLSDRIAGYKLPKTIDFITELPRNPSGKVLKRELRKPFWEGRKSRV